MWILGGLKHISRTVWHNVFSLNDYIQIQRRINVYVTHNTDFSFFILFLFISDCLILYFHISKSIQVFFQCIPHNINLEKFSALCVYKHRWIWMQLCFVLNYQSEICLCCHLCTTVYHQVLLQLLWPLIQQLPPAMFAMVTLSLFNCFVWIYQMQQHMLVNHVH